MVGYNVFVACFVVLGLCLIFMFILRVSLFIFVIVYTRYKGSFILGTLGGLLHLYGCTCIVNKSLSYTPILIVC